MAAAASFPLPAASPTIHARNLRVVEALAEASPASTPPPPMSRLQAYDLLAATSVGAAASTLEFGERKILGRFVTFSTPRRRAIKGKGRTSPILIPTKDGGIELLGEGSTWEEAWQACSRRVGASS